MYKKIKEQMGQLEEENEALRKQLQIANSKQIHTAKKEGGSPAISIRPNRISIKSPSVRQTTAPMIPASPNYLQLESPIPR